MAPPLSPFHTSELEWQVQVTEKGKVRKPRVDLEKCALQEMLQYNCNMNGAGTIVCVPVQRLFRRYVLIGSGQAAEWSSTSEAEVLICG